MNTTSEIWYNKARMIYYGRLGDKIVSAGSQAEVEQKIEELKKNLSICDDCDLAHPNCNRCIGA